MNDSRSPLPVMLLCTSLSRGGAEMQVTQLALELHRLGYDVSVVSMIEPTAFVGELRDGGIEVHSLGMKPGRLSAMGLLRLLALLRTLRPAVLHAHLFHANLLARFASLLCAVPVVLSTIHSLAESGRASNRVGLRDWLYRLTNGLSHRTICVSEAVAQRHLASRAISSGRTLVIPNGANPALFPQRPQTRALIRKRSVPETALAWLGGRPVMWKKDYVTMLRAMASQPHGKLFIAGEGPLEGELGNLAASLGARVQFLGLREDIPDLMSACDGFVMSSVVEGLPMVLIEAAMAGLPAVATDVGGVQEVLLDGETGFTVPPQDVDGLAEAMGRLAAMPVEARRRMGDAARGHAIGKFSLSEVAARWDRLYRDCLAISQRQRMP
ncbi:MAG: glycosyltransferase [Bryobacterales bacterium]|nr:glycosyltransferase [Bryobacterales bacterium]